MAPKISRTKADKSNFTVAYCTRAQLYCDLPNLKDGPQGDHAVPQLRTELQEQSLRQARRMQAVNPVYPNRDVRSL